LHAQNQGRLQATQPNEDDSDYTSFDLSQFTIYQPSESVLGVKEMVPLNVLKTKYRCDELLIDGIVSFNGTEFHLRAVPFEELSIEGYGDTECHSITDYIWIQTLYGQTSNTFYRLKTPHSDYLQFHSSFLWTADLAKYFIDFLAENDMVQLADFRSKFYEWLIAIHGSSAQFQSWISQFKGTDFRTAVIAHTEYLWKEAWAVIKPVEELESNPIWAEILDFTAIPWQKNENTPEDNQSTVVTPFVYECFRDTYFGSVLDVRHTQEAAVLTAQQRMKEELGFTYDSFTRLIGFPVMLPPTDIQRGDIIALPRSESVWHDEADTWFGLFIIFILSIKVLIFRSLCSRHSK
jgi:DNA (cytosine-5)-methyltransferase 1